MMREDHCEKDKSLQDKTEQTLKPLYTRSVVNLSDPIDRTNLIVSFVTFFGSLIGGYLSDYMKSLFGLITRLQIVYLISTVGRAIGAELQFTLEETLKK